MSKTKTSWQKGKSGNPKGRPKKEFCLTDLLTVKLQQKSSSKKPNIEVILDKLIEVAQQGDMKAIVFIYERLEGKVPNKIEGSISNPSKEDQDSNSNISDEELVKLLQH